MSGGPGPEEAASATAGAARGLRGLADRALLPLFCAQFALLDLAFAHGRAAALESGAGAVATFQSVCLWLGVAAAARRGGVIRIGAALLAGFALAVQLLFRQRFSQWIDARVVHRALADLHDVAPALRAELPALAIGTVAAAGIELAWLGAAARGRARWREVAAPWLVAAALVPFGAAAAGPPDLRLAAAIASPRVSHAGPAGRAVALPELPPRRGRTPNVVLIVTESVRADEYCSAHVEDCPTSPRVNALLPDRIALPEMRALASFTAVSMAAIVTGRSQEIGQAELFASPTLFDAAKAIDTGGARVSTAFWSAHYAPVFHWEDPKRAVDSYVTHETLYGAEDDDERGDVRLAALVKARLAELPSPFFAVLHFHDTHLLYSFDEARAPFAPWSRKVRWDTMGELKNAYRNAIHFQDGLVAGVIEALKADPRWPQTFVMFTSDHGEAFGEHKQIHHGQDLLDEQIHVPGWIAFGGDVLTGAEERALRENAGGFHTHLDVAPTLLDVMGVLDAFGLAPHVARMPGRSLLRRDPAPLPAVAMTNCSEALPCAWSTWGLLRGDRKLEAQAWDLEWRCHGLAGGEAALPLTEPGCAALLAESRARFERHPNGQPNRD